MSSQSHSKSNQLDLKITRISRFEFNSKGIFSSDTIVSSLCYLEMQQLGCSKTNVKHPLLSLFHSIIHIAKSNDESKTIARDSHNTKSCVPHSFYTLSSPQDSMTLINEVNHEL